MKQRPSLYRNCSIPLSCLLACFFLSIAGAQAQTLEQCRETYQGQLDIVATRNEEAIATAMESYRVACMRYGEMCRALATWTRH